MVQGLIPEEHRFWLGVLMTVHYRLAHAVFDQVDSFQLIQKVHLLFHNLAASRATSRDKLCQMLFQSRYTMWQESAVQLVQTIQRDTRSFVSWSTCFSWNRVAQGWSQVQLRCKVLQRWVSRTLEIQDQLVRLKLMSPTISVNEVISSLLNRFRESRSSHKRTGECR